MSKMTMTTSGHPVTVTGLITDRAGRLLIVHPTRTWPVSGGTWWLPGGALVHGHSPAESLRRTVYAQISLHVQVEGLHLTAYKRAISRGEQPELVLLFDCGRYDAGDLEADIWPREGIAAWRWAEPAEAMRLLDTDEVRRMTWARHYPRASTYLEQPQHYDPEGAACADDAVGRPEATSGAA